MSGVLKWVKSNIYIVIFVILMIAAGVAMPLVSSKMNAKVKAEVQKRANMRSDLEKLEQTSFVTPGDPTAQPQKVLVNDKLLEAYERVVEEQREDGDRVYELAIGHNQGRHGVLMPELLPDPPAELREVLPKQFHGRLIDAYGALMSEVNAGPPPDSATVAEALKERKERFITSMLAMANESDLDDEQRKKLREELSEARNHMCSERAKQVSFYASLDVLGLPQWNQARSYTMGELFDWQWTYWIYDDLLQAMHAANGTDPVSDAPVKRLVAVAVSDSNISAAGAAAAGGAGAAGGFGAGRQRPGAGRGGGGGGDAAAGPAATPINPKAEAPLNYSMSLTGRQTNPIYDVRYLQVEMVIDPERLPEILDALAKQNFITVIDLQMVAGEPFSPLNSGYFYGPGGVATLRLNLETVWLRDWTQQFMPEAVRQTLGIPVEQAGMEGATDA